MLKFTFYFVREIDSVTVWEETQDNNNKDTRIFSKDRLCNRRKMRISHWLHIEFIWKKTQDNYNKSIWFFSKNRLHNRKKTFDFERES
jgi:hypothetical protein